MFHWMPWLRSGGRFVFVLGREDVIPEMIKRLLSLWEHGRSRFAYYLNGIGRGPRV
jgi:hypothetical protein